MSLADALSHRAVSSAGWRVPRKRRHTLHVLPCFVQWIQSCTEVLQLQLQTKQKRRDWYNIHHNRYLHRYDDTDTWTARSILAHKAIQQDGDDRPWPRSWSQRLELSIVWYRDMGQERLRITAATEMWLVNEPGDAFISSPVAELEDTKQMMKKWVTQDRMIRLPLSGGGL